MKSLQEVFVLGGGGHGAEIVSYLTELTLQGAPLRLAGVIDDNKPVGPWRNHRISGPIEWLKSFLLDNPKQVFYYITAIGDNAVRKNFVDRVESLGAPNLRPLALVHAHAVIGTSNEIGEGTCLAPGAIVTTHAKIGKHCIVNVKASVSHDSVVGDYANLNPNCTIAGNVTVGEGAFIGAGATVIHGVKVGNWAVVGAGAVVIKDIPDQVTAVGVPTRIVKTHRIQRFSA